MRRRVLRGLSMSAGGVDFAEGDVFGNRVIKQEGLLRHQCGRRAQTVERHIANILPVNCDVTRVNVEKPQSQIQQGRLARSGSTDQRDGLSGGHFQ